VTKIRAEKKDWGQPNQGIFAGASRGRREDTPDLLAAKRHKNLKADSALKAPMGARFTLPAGQGFLCALLRQIIRPHAFSTIFRVFSRDSRTKNPALKTILQEHAEGAEKIPLIFRRKKAQESEGGFGSQGAYWRAVHSGRRPRFPLRSFAANLRS
jgi:hypothetical protein